MGSVARRALLTFVSALFAACTTSSAHNGGSVAPALSAETQGGLVWAMNDSLRADCIPEYLDIPETTQCLANGNRSCVMQAAIASARAGDCNKAFSMALVPQCQNPEVRRSLIESGPAAVCEFLKTKPLLRTRQPWEDPRLGQGADVR